MVQPESAVTRFQRERERVGGAGCGGVGGRGLFTCVYILININRTGQSSDSGVSGHKGSTVKRIFGEVKGSSLWGLCYWSCDKVEEH